MKQHEKVSLNEERQNDNSTYDTCCAKPLEENTHFGALRIKQKNMNIACLEQTVLLEGFWLVAK